MIELINGDMLVELTKLEPKSIDLLVADLPYGCTGAKWDNKIDLEALWIELKRVAKPNTAFMFFCTTKFGYELIKSNEKWFRYDLVWNKENASGFLWAKKMPMRQHEMIYVFYDKLPIYNIADNHIYTPKIVNESYNCSTVYKNENLKIKVTGSQYVPTLPKSILNVSVNKYRKRQRHPTEKPIAIYEHIIKYYTNKDGKVLDVCFGSGNSAIAAKNLERDYIGIELDKTYYDNAVSVIFSPPVC
jgi:site-specific DNA-methyltransferase (adenine-specific)